MPHPIRGFSGSYTLRPGWSEFGSWRAGGTHQGFDYYCPIGTPIYGTSDGGFVTGKGGPDGAPGWQVTVRYPNYITRNVHMNGPSPLAIGAKVNSNTVIGHVGATGNAANIVWNNKRHLHHEVYPNGYDGPVDPLWYYGSIPDPGLAGGDVTPITPEIEDDMFSDADRALLRSSRPTRELIQTPDGTVWFVWNRIERYAIPREANLNTYKAYLRDLGHSDAIVQKSATDISAFGVPVYDGGLLLTALGNDRVAAAVIAALPLASGGTGPTAQEIAAAVVAALPPSQGGTGPSAQEIALAVEAQLADNFGNLPAAVNLDLKNRL